MTLLEPAACRRASPRKAPARPQPALKYGGRAALGRPRPHECVPSDGRGCAIQSSYSRASALQPASGGVLQGRVSPGTGIPPPQKQGCPGILQCARQAWIETPQWHRRRTRAEPRSVPTRRHEGVLGACRRGGAGRGHGNRRPQARPSRSRPTLALLGQLWRQLGRCLNLGTFTLPPVTTRSRDDRLDDTTSVTGTPRTCSVTPPSHESLIPHELPVWPRRTVTQSALAPCHIQQQRARHACHSTCTVPPSAASRSSSQQHAHRTYVPSRGGVELHCSTP